MTKENKHTGLRKEYQEELKLLKAKMIKAQNFAEKIPALAEIILERKVTGYEEYFKFGDSYKKLYLGWGINRSFYRSGGVRYIMNYPKDKEYNLPLFSIYVNTYAMFDEHQLFDLYKYLEGVDIFFSDSTNTTFYITDENIGTFLEALNTWYIDACEQLKKYRLQKKKEQLEKELAQADKALSSIDEQALNEAHNG